MKVCMVTNIEGLLRNTKRKSLAGLIDDDNGKSLSDREAREALNECLAKGEKYLPMGKACEHFSPFEGCMCLKNEQNKSKISHLEGEGE